MQTNKSPSRDTVPLNFQLPPSFICILCLFLPKKAVAEGDWPPMGKHNDVPGLHPTEGVHICYEQSLYKETASVENVHKGEGN